MSSMSAAAKAVRAAAVLESSSGAGMSRPARAICRM